LLNVAEVPLLVRFDVTFVSELHSLIKPTTGFGEWKTSLSSPVPFDPV
jgi:hypothetical protein